MATAIMSRLRTALWAGHRWIALALCIVLVPIALSGALLVFKDQLDAVIHPGRYAVPRRPCFPCRPEMSLPFRPAARRAPASNAAAWALDQQMASAQA